MIDKEIWDDKVFNSFKFKIYSYCLYAFKAIKQICAKKKKYFFLSFYSIFLVYAMQAGFWIWIRLDLGVMSDLDMFFFLENSCLSI